VPPPGLEQRITARIGQPRPERRARYWPALAAALLVGVAIGAVASAGLFQTARGNAIADTIVANNLRALMAPDPVQVASSDRHTVKPWFDGKLTFAPDVIDLADQGFPLVGGRIDIVELAPVPSLVYRHDQHLITLTESRAGIAASGATSERGFARLAPGHDGLLGRVRRFPDELDTFVRLFRCDGQPRYAVPFTLGRASGDS
jgi:anti-sigma factor RsiW